MTTIFVLAFISSCGSQDDNRDNKNKQDIPPDNRKPAVAGQFYPGDSVSLKSMLKEMFGKAEPKKSDKQVLAVISPHAGYVFSGIVSASSFNQIDPDKSYDNIFIIGSSHSASFEGASIYSKGNFETPLGTVKVNRVLAEKLIEENSFFVYNKSAHASEHSLEVQLPFLQYKMKKDFRIIPILIGSYDNEMPKKIANALKPYFNSHNLFVISTDFSHYPSYGDANKIDKLTMEGIVSNSPENFLQVINSNTAKTIPQLATCVCGWTSVLTLLYMTEGNKEISYLPIQYKNSGDAEYGEKSRVVGYYSIAVTSNVKEEKSEFNLTGKDKKDLLNVARKTITEYVSNRKVPAIDTSGFSEVLFTKCGAFVTLKENGQLRGCIGRFSADEPLYKVIQLMAISSSTEDSRFSPVTNDEIKKIEIEISVLSPMKRIKTIDEIVMGKHGIYIKKGPYSGTFLPQVATETGWTKEEFLGHCSRDKAGLGWTGWKDAEIYIYEAVVFSE